MSSSHIYYRNFKKRHFPRWFKSIAIIADYVLTLYVLPTYKCAHKLCSQICIGIEVKGHIIFIKTRFLLNSSVKHKMDSTKIGDL